MIRAESSGRRGEHWKCGPDFCPARAHLLVMETQRHQHASAQSTTQTPGAKNHAARMMLEIKYTHTHIIYLDAISKYRLISDLQILYKKEKSPALSFEQTAVSTIHEFARTHAQPSRINAPRYSSAKAKTHGLSALNSSNSPSLHIPLSRRVAEIQAAHAHLDL